MAHNQKTIDAAKTLWLGGYTIEETARILSLSTNTVHRWKQDGDWDDLKLRIQTMQENTLSKLMEVFDFEVECLHRKMKLKQETQEWDEFGGKTWDSVLKAYNVVKRDRIQFDDIIRVMAEFTEWVSARDLELAKTLTTHVDLFINEKSRNS
jgi:uncharacterized protein YjcR